MHVVPGQSPTTEDRRDGFATNVRQLLRVLQIRPKDAARQIGVPDKWLWRIAQAGISRISDRQLVNLQRFAAYFHVPSVDDFWRESLLCWLVSSDEGSGFVEKFRQNLEELYADELRKVKEIDQDFLEAARKRLGLVANMNVGRLAALSSAESQSSGLASSEKLAALVATGRHEGLKLMEEGLRQQIDEAYEREFRSDKVGEESVGQEQPRKAANA